MFGIESLDVMISIVTIYLIFALSCTAIVEAFSTWLSVRRSNLEATLGEFLHGCVKESKQAITDLPGTSRDSRIKGLFNALHRDAGEDIAAFRKLIAAKEADTKTTQKTNRNKMGAPP